MPTPELNKCQCLLVVHRIVRDLAAGQRTYGYWLLGALDFLNIVEHLSGELSLIVWASFVLGQRTEIIKGTFCYCHSEHLILLSGHNSKQAPARGFLSASRGLG